MDKISDMKYIKRMTRSDGSHQWYFNPPKRYVDAGVVKPCVVRDGRTLRRKHKEWMGILKRYDKGEIGYSDVDPTTTLRQLSGFYERSKHFNSLSSSTQKLYRQYFKTINDTPVTGKKDFGDIKIKDITSRMCSGLYDKWVDRGPSAAAMMVRCFSVLMTYAMSFDAVPRNPMAVIKKVPEKRETQAWTREQVVQFLDTAYSDFKWRNIGLVVHMAFEWCQRPIDILNLKWDNIDFDKQTVYIKQQKRGSEVFLPISDELFILLKQQREDFKEQPYVVPYFRKADETWKPMTKDAYVRCIREVTEAAGLPDTLKGGSLRKSGVIEMQDGGADVSSIMSVTGHRSLGSLSPYMKHTLKAAKEALSHRGD